jgi:hypothetical protein
MTTTAAALLPALLAAQAIAQCDPATLFAQPAVTQLLAGSIPNDILAADLDADGNQDLVISEPGTDSVALLFGRGDGTFDPPVRLGIADGLRTPGRLALGDVSGDGTPDLLVSNGFNTEIVVFRANGDARSRTPGPSTPISSSHRQT